MDITLLISTHNKPHLLERCINHYRDFNCKKIILDSSHTKYTDNITDFEYCFYENFRLEAKIRQYCIDHKVSTKYVLYVDHDDIYFKNSTQSCISYLDNDLRYGGCAGFKLGFYGKHIRVDRDKFYSGDYLGYIQEYDPDTKTRLENCFINLGTRIYAVMRKNVFVNFWKNVPDFKIADLLETSCKQFYAIHGTIKVLPMIFCARSLDDSTRDRRKYNYNSIWRIGPHKEADLAMQFIANLCNMDISIVRKSYLNQWEGKSIKVQAKQLNLDFIDENIQCLSQIQ